MAWEGSLPQVEVFAAADLDLEVLEARAKLRFKEEIQHVAAIRLRVIEKAVGWKRRR